MLPACSGSGLIRLPPCCLVWPQLLVGCHSNANPVLQPLIQKPVSDVIQVAYFSAVFDADIFSTACGLEDSFPKKGQENTKKEITHDK